MQEVFRLVERWRLRARRSDYRRKRYRKELIAKAIHEASPQVTKPFVTSTARTFRPSCSNPNCSAARAARIHGRGRGEKGLFGVADGGSIFLDEIGDIPPETRCPVAVIQEREFTPLETSATAGGCAHQRRRTSICEGPCVRNVPRGPFYRLSVVPNRIAAAA
jgi:hypothetical protein